MKKFAYVLAMVLLVNLMSCAKQQNTAHLEKSLEVLVEEIQDFTVFSFSRDIGDDEVQTALSALLMDVPGVTSVTVAPNFFIVHQSNSSEKNKKNLVDEVERLLKFRFETKKIVITRPTRTQMEKNPFIKSLKP